MNWRKPSSALSDFCYAADGVINKDVEWKGYFADMMKYHDTKTFFLIQGRSFYGLLHHQSQTAVLWWIWTFVDLLEKHKALLHLLVFQLCLHDVTILLSGMFNRNSLCWNKHLWFLRVNVTTALYSLTSASWAIHLFLGSQYWTRSWYIAGLSTNIRMIFCMKENDLLDAIYDRSRWGTLATHHQCRWNLQ